jgi:cytochrome b561
MSIHKELCHLDHGEKPDNSQFIHSTLRCGITILHIIVLAMPILGMLLMTFLSTHISLSGKSPPSSLPGRKLSHWLDRRHLPK